MSSYSKRSTTAFPVHESRSIQIEDPKFPRAYPTYTQAPSPYAYDRQYYSPPTHQPRQSQDKTMWWLIGIPSCCCVCITIFVIILLVFVHYGEFYNSNWRNGWFW